MADRWTSIGLDEPTARLIRLVARIEGVSVVTAVRAAFDLVVRSRYGNYEGLKAAAEEMRAFSGFGEQRETSEEGTNSAAGRHRRARRPHAHHRR